MKQLRMTPELGALIKSRVGEDVDPENLAVFEAIALNTKPLPGKDGTIFEDAVVKPVTLAQMVDYITGGNHLPLVADHELFGAPKGRFFDARLFSEDNSLDELEMRALIYLDKTEQETIDKLDAGSLDEVSVAFLSSAFLCSECGWDYFSQGTPENIATRTCANGHTIGEDGVHAELVGLNQFIELSLVARGAADKPKIVGQSQSKLAPEAAYRLAANGFEVKDLVLKASMGKEEDMDTTKLVADFAEATASNAVLTANNTRLEGSVTALTSERDTATARVTELEGELAAAKDAKPEDYEAALSTNVEAVTFLQEQLNNLRVAKGEAKLEGDALPKEIADLKSQITEVTGQLTAILPVGGLTEGASKGDDAEAKLAYDASAFSTRK